MAATWVLYVARDHDDPSRLCAGSRACMRALSPIADECDVQSVEELEEAGELPEYVDGTPLLMHVASRKVLRGSDSVHYLGKRMAAAEAAAEAAHATAAANRAAVDRPPSDRPPPAERPPPAMHDEPRPVAPPVDAFAPPPPPGGSAGAPLASAFASEEPVGAPLSAAFEEAPVASSMAQNFAAPLPAALDEAPTGKVTEGDLQEYIRRRNAGAAGA